MTKEIERRVDELGRIVLPKEMRQHFGMKVGDTLKILITDEGILLKKKSDTNEE